MSVTDVAVDVSLIVSKLERKLWYLIVPFLMVDYAFYYIDKTTLAYAALFGIKTDLGLVGEYYC